MFFNFLTSRLCSFRSDSAMKIIFLLLIPMVLMLGLLPAVEGGEGVREMTEDAVDPVPDEAAEDAEAVAASSLVVEWWLALGPRTERRTGITKRPCQRPNTTVSKNTLKNVRKICEVEKPSNARARKRAEETHSVCARVCVIESERERDTTRVTRRRRECAIAEHTHTQTTRVQIETPTTAKLLRAIPDNRIKHSANQSVRCVCVCV